MSELKKVSWGTFVENKTNLVRFVMTNKNDQFIARQTSDGFSASLKDVVVENSFKLEELFNNVYKKDYAEKLFCLETDDTVSHVFISYEIIEKSIMEKLIEDRKKENTNIMFCNIEKEPNNTYKSVLSFDKQTYMISLSEVDEFILSSLLEYEHSEEVAQQLPLLQRNKQHYNIIRLGFLQRDENHELMMFRSFAGALQCFCETDDMVAEATKMVNGILESTDIKFKENRLKAVSTHLVKSKIIHTFVYLNEDKSESPKFLTNIIQNATKQKYLSDYAKKEKQSFFMYTNDKEEFFALEEDFDVVAINNWMKKQNKLQ